MSKIHYISDQPLTLEQVQDIIYGEYSLQLSPEAAEKINKCRNYLDQKVQTSSEPVYGINTGFGSLYNKNISKDDLSKLQENLVKSHACGTGAEVPEDIVRLMLLLKIQSLSYGNSGTQLATVNRLIDFFNEGIHPVVYEMGSLGASGDLAPLAHLSLPLIGLGEVNYKGKRYSGKDINEQMGYDLISFRAKEGLALLNGTQLMSAYGVWSLINGGRLLELANTIGALSLDGFDGRIEPFYDKVHQIRPQRGQISTATRFRELLDGSEIISQPKKHVQDPYSFRCIPQVHGASADAIAYVKEIFLTEINGVTDNPNVFPDDDQIISAGNFHGQPLALPLDFLCLALAELGNISERRTYQLISGARDLPNYLVANPGINSGLMIPQYTAASLVSQNKQYCTPASADSIVSSNGQEDHVSMGANAAVKVYKVVNNLCSILAIELITATQALEFRRPLKTSPFLESFVSNFREKVPFIEDDRVLYEDIARAVQFLRTVRL
ncbi:Histidine ammonia-lyase [Fulvivirga imtechensis AK7]|uniref:Histidine ammonia-lyase n=1 Tax=Fulvivirga imtechensis AK7 TaxID=1237149 RepID=L8JRL8_9BACT|nr:histidine ammonia-lyase [Fulvivirga imtechensis]ELR70007.1 Histidine ammonia-lyase [Fulvivirga imtechensis AK7]